MRCFPAQPIELGDLLPAKVVISLSVSGFLPASPHVPNPGNFHARAHDIAQAASRHGEQSRVTAIFGAENNLEAQPFFTREARGRRMAFDL